MSSSLPASEQGVRQWSEAELISLAERMQHDLDIKTRCVGGAGPVFLVKVHLDQ